MMREHKFLSGNRRSLCVKILRRDSTPPVREKREIAEGVSSAPRLASSSAVSFPGRNECPRTHCSLIEQEKKKDRSATEFEIRGENRTRVRQKEKRRKMVDFMVLPRPAKSVQNGAGFSGKT